MSPHDSIERYFSAVEAVLARLPAYAENYSEEVLTPERANLRIRLRFDNGALLVINELSKIHDKVRNLLPRHSGEGRNPVNLTSPALRDNTQLHFE